MKGERERGTTPSQVTVQQSRCKSGVYYMHELSPDENPVMDMDCMICYQKAPCSYGSLAYSSTIL